MTKKKKNPTTKIKLINDSGYPWTQGWTKY